MNLARVVGKVWATQKDPALEQSALLVLQPLDGEGRDSGEKLAAVDPLGCLVSQQVFYIGSKEAALPLKGALVPVDATITGIVDLVDRN